MNIEQAKEIVRSETQVLVTLEGSSVWIDQLDETTNTAIVHDQASGKPIRVDVERLHAQ